VLAHGRAHTELPVGVPIYSVLVRAAAHNGARAPRQLLNVHVITRGDVIFVLQVDLDVVFEDAGNGAGGRNARGVVEALPLAGAAENEIGQEKAGDRAVRHAVARVAGAHEDVGVVAGVAANVAEAVGGLNNL